MDERLVKGGGHFETAVYSRNGNSSLRPSFALGAVSERSCFLAPLAMNLAPYAARATQNWVL